LLVDPEGAARRARAARARVESFSEERILPALERYYLGPPAGEDLVQRVHTWVALSTAIGQTAAGAVV
jgi:hypothetical protein